MNGSESGVGARETISEIILTTHRFLSKMESTTADADTSAVTNNHVIAMIEASSKGDVPKVKSLIGTNNIYACQQDENTGQSPLIAAAAAGHMEIVKILLEAGAPWNAVDKKGQCAGNFATDAEHWDIVNLLVDAGTKAELILGASIRLQKQLQQSSSQEISSASNEDQLSSNGPVEKEPCSKPDYINKHRVRYNEDKTALLDDDDDAVMMEWERPIMDAHASILMEPAGKRVMNIGFGMGIIDTALQKLQPALHIIVEAHPDVYQQMLDDKWDEKPCVRICFGKWQDEIPKLIQEGVVLDGIFYDTYAENFMDLEDFHSLALPNLLSQPDGVYSFFNGLAPDNLFFHGVACQCVKLQLARLGLETEFLPCQIEVADDVWEGVRRKYWHGRDTYYLPLAKWSKEHLKKGKQSKNSDAKDSYKQPLDSSEVAVPNVEDTDSKRAKPNP